MGYALKAKVIRLGLGLWGQGWEYGLRVSELSAMELKAHTLVDVF